MRDYFDLDFTYTNRNCNKEMRHYPCAYDVLINGQSLHERDEIIYERGWVDALNKLVVLAKEKNCSTTTIHELERLIEQLKGEEV